MPALPAIETKDPGRTYKLGGKKEPRRELVAPQDVKLRIECGELFGLLGPNGAGKTTLIKIQTTPLSPTSGWARVSGADVHAEPGSARPKINVDSEVVKTPNFPPEIFFLQGAWICLRGGEVAFRAIASKLG